MVLVVTGCATAPPAEPPDLAVAVPSEWSGENVSSEALATEWWDTFGDTGLTAAIRATIEHNYDLQAAVARVDQAAATARIAGADLQPTLSVSLGAARRRQNFIGLPIPGREGGVLTSQSTTLGVSLDTAWEVDLWGRLRAGVRASLADLQASAATLRGAYLSITGQTAKTWFAIAEAQQQVDLAPLAPRVGLPRRGPAPGDLELRLRIARDQDAQIDNRVGALSHHIGQRPLVGDPQLAVVVPGQIGPEDHRRRRHVVRRTIRGLCEFGGGELRTAGQAPVILERAPTFAVGVDRAGAIEAEPLVLLRLPARLGDARDRA